MTGSDLVVGSVATADRERRVSRETAIIVVVSFGAGLSALDLSLMFVTYPSIRAAFPDEPVALTSWVLTSYTIVTAALMVPAGRLADRVGRRRMFLAALGLFALGSSCCALAPTVPLLIAARVVTAIGGATLIPSSLALIMSALPVERRASAIGIWSAITGAMTTTGPVIGAICISVGGWRWPFLVAAPIAATVAVVGRRLLPESIDPDAGPIPDLFGSVLVVLGVAALALAIVESGTWGAGDRRTLGAVALAAAVLTTFVVRCARHPVPVIDLRVFRPVAFRATAVCALAMGVAFYASYYLFVVVLLQGWDYTVLSAGFLLVPMTLGASLIGVPAGRWMDRRGMGLPMVLAAVAMATAMLWLVIALDERREIGAVWLPAVVVVGAASTIFLMGVNSAGTRTAPPEVLGVTAAVVQTLIRVGGAMGSALGVALVASSGTAMDDLHHAFAAVGVAAVVAALASVPLVVLRVGVPTRSEAPTASG